MPTQRNKTEDDITTEVLQRFSTTPDPRLKQITLEAYDRMVGLVTHVAALAERVPVRFVVSRDGATSTLRKETV